MTDDDMEVRSFDSAWDAAEHLPSSGARFLETLVWFHSASERGSRDDRAEHRGELAGAPPAR
jgi:hypothetical protein